MSLETVFAKLGSGQPVSAGEAAELARYARDLEHFSNVVQAAQKAMTIDEQPWIDATLLNSWTNYSESTYGKAGYYKDASGTVWVRGIVSNGSPLTANVFVLPEGYRPEFHISWPAIANEAIARVRILSTGDVAFPSGGSATWSSIGEISFRAYK